jgi:hypothetical protein
MVTKTPEPVPDGRTPMDRMADLTRRIVAVPKSEVVKAKPKPKKS